MRPPALDGTWHGHRLGFTYVTREALAALAYLRKVHVDDEAVKAEYAEIEAAIEEERNARVGLGFKEAFLGKGNWPRFVIAFVIFLLQQWSGQNSVGYVQSSFSHSRKVI